MQRKPHPAEIASRARIVHAVYFNVHLRFNPQEKFNERAETLAQAVGIFDRLVAQYPRKSPMIYAVLPDNTSEFVPADMIDAARAAAAPADTVKEPLTQSQISQLTAILTGGGFKRANSKASAEARFINVAIENGFTEDRAKDLLKGPMKFSEGVLRRHVGGNAPTAEEVKATRAENPEAFADIPPSHRFAEANRAADLRRSVGDESGDGSMNSASKAKGKGNPAEAARQAAAVREMILSRDVGPAKADEYPAPTLGKSASRQAAIDLLKNDAVIKAAAETAAKSVTGKRAAVIEAAQRGELPSAPDFSAETHRRYRNKLAGIVALAEAGDIAGLKAVVINPISSSPKAMAKYRDLCVIALEAKAARKETA